MSRTLLVAALLALTFPAKAATYYVATTGNDANPGTEGSPFRWPQACVNAMSAGDTCIVKPGTYGTAAARVTIQNKSGTVNNRITLRAENPAVSCPDPVNDPDGCTINANNRTILNSGGTQINIAGANADYWIIEGFEIKQARPAVDIGGTSLNNGPDNIIVRYMHIWEETPLGGQGVLFDVSHANNTTLEHSYFRNTATDGTGPDYATRIHVGAQNTVLNNIVCLGSSNYCASIRNYSINTTATRIVCEGIRLECIAAGPFADSPAAGGSTPTSCPNSTFADGSVATAFDQTTRGATVRRVFARPATVNGVFHDSQRGAVVSNINNLVGESWFFANMTHSGIYTHGNFSSGVMVNCGQEAGNNVIRGLIVVDGPRCLQIGSNGDDPATLIVDNMVCHSPSSAAINLFEWTEPTIQLNGSCSPHIETCEHATITFRNATISSCSSPLSDDNSGRTTQNHNNVSSCGTLSGTGNQAVDPQFVGPTTVANGSINLAHGLKLWDWAGTYQPIIERFRTQNAPLLKRGESAALYQPVIDRFRSQNPSFVDAGSGTAAPCTGSACDIGANEFFFFELPPDMWQSCAVYGNDDTVFGSFANPWIAGRNGLVVDVDCEQKRFVIGRCDDPTDESTCDTDIYVHKAAQVRKKRVNEPITLSAGTSASSADTSGLCWRTRAIFDFTESLEDLTGIWVRYEVAPNGGTHDCTCMGAECPQWAWQGAE
jgi:hypothetical protein